MNSEFNFSHARVDVPFLPGDLDGARPRQRRRQAEPLANLLSGGRFQRDRHEVGVRNVQIHRNAFVVPVDTVPIPAELGGVAPATRHVDGGETVIAGELLIDGLVPDRQSAGICCDLGRRLLGLHEVLQPHLCMLDLQAIGGAGLLTPEAADGLIEERVGRRGTSGAAGCNGENE